MPDPSSKRSLQEGPRLDTAEFIVEVLKGRSGVQVEDIRQRVAEWRPAYAIAVPGIMGALAKAGVVRRRMDLGPNWYEHVPGMDLSHPKPAPTPAPPVPTPATVTGTVREQMVEEVRAHPGTTTAEVAKSLGITGPHASTELHTLVNLGKLEVVKGTMRHHFWVKGARREGDPAGTGTHPAGAPPKGQPEPKLKDVDCPNNPDKPAVLDYAVAIGPELYDAVQREVKAHPEIFPSLRAFVDFALRNQVLSVRGAR